MTTLFTEAELTVYAKQAVSDASYDLAHMLTLDALQGEVGSRLADPPQPGVKAIAIALASRMLTNPGGLRSATAGAVAETYTDGTSGIVLTSDERRRLRRAVGLPVGATMLDISPPVVDRPYGFRRWPL